ncbi:DUF1697 domain-containing protein [Neomicrococcus lactis]|uniref:DUF1697 domain-containing protein n=1 Tax=Neomicrococcus lactis TaxID=732241 RepID=UPI00161BC932|nr:DUF1697 domain-containing protein [Neomicrococcus lactis]
MKYVALFRNLNLGQKGSPSSGELLDAFGGPEVATNFQTNGTVVFETTDLESTKNLVKTRLAESGYLQSFSVLTLEEMAEFAAQAPQVDPAGNVYRVMASFFDAPEEPQIALPLRSKNNLVEVRSISRNHAWSLTWKPNSSVGNVTGLLEEHLGVPVTSRTASTVGRLVKKFSDS